MPKAATGPRRINGKYWAVKTVKGVKLSKCLGTNKAQAQRDWPAAYAALGAERTRLYDPLELVKIVTPEGEELRRAMDIFPASELTFDPNATEGQPTADAWEEAFEAARRRHQRRQHKPLSKSWETQIRIVKTYLPKDVPPEQMQPQHIRKMMLAMEADGHGDSTISTRIATLGGVFTALIKSGLHPDMDNPCSKVDYVSPSLRSHKTASEEHYKQMLNSDIKDHPLLLRIVYLGLRVGEAIHGRVEGDTYIIEPTGDWSPKNKSSIRTLPIPVFLRDSVVYISSNAFGAIFRKARKDNALVPHSFRHGFVQLARQLHCNPLVIEAVLGHRLPSQMMDVYGDGYNVDTMRVEMEKIWQHLEMMSVNVKD